MADVFAADFKQDFPQISEDHEDISNYFLQRLQTLKKVLDRGLPRDEETTEEHAQRFEERQQRVLAEGRRRARRDRVSLYSPQWGCKINNFLQQRVQTRINICTSGKEGDSNGAWELLFAMVETLGSDGHSSDESDDEDKKAVLIKDWRSAEVGELLRFIDENRTTTNSYGTTLPGTLPSVRVRGNYGPISSKTAVAHLPRNFYDDAWYNTLTHIEKVQLGAVDVVELPVIS